MVYLIILVFVISVVSLGAFAAFVLRQQEEPTDSPKSFLAPILAADALDGDLKVVYARTLLLDAKCQKRWGSDPVKLGAEIRRFLLETQNQRVLGNFSAKDCLLEVEEIAQIEVSEVVAALETQKLRVRALRTQLGKNGTSGALQAESV